MDLTKELLVFVPKQCSRWSQTCKTAGRPYTYTLPTVSALCQHAHRGEGFLRTAIFSKMGHSQPLFLFVFSIQLIVIVQYKFWPMIGLEPRTSGIGSNRSTTTTACGQLIKACNTYLLIGKCCCPTEGPYTFIKIRT